MNLLKTNIIFCLFISSSFFCLCQQKIKGKIIDNSNNELPNVTITNLGNKKQVLSNNNGTFEIPHKGIYAFKKSGYIEKTIEIQNTNYLIVQLSINLTQLNEITINGNHVPKKLKKATTAINVISTKDIERSNNTNTTSILNRTPGVFMQSGALNTNRIIMRGVGSRNLFGSSKIRAYFKDIPLTNGNGETNIEDLELGAISRLEIIKGAVSSTYGAGLGGTIHLIPQQGYFNLQAINNGLTIGSFGLIKGLTSLNLSSETNSFKAIYSNTHSNGYRENNAYIRQTFTLNSNHYISKKDELSVLASYTNLKAFIPSSLNETTYLNNPKSAAFIWKSAKGFEDSKIGGLGLSWNRQHTSTLKQATSIFTSFRNNYEPRPFNILSETTFAFGIRSRLIGNSKLFKKPLNWTLGGELFKDNLKTNTFKNLYQDFPEGTGSVKGHKLSYFKEKRSYHNVFFEVNYDFSSKTTLSIGMNLNETSYVLKDLLPVSPDNIDQSGQFKFKSIISPKFGVSYQYSKDINLFTSISHGFSPIPLNETLLPEGQINTNLKPETGWNFEIGTRGTTLNNRLQFNVSVYSLIIKNLLVARRTSEDQFVGINAGKTKHNGLEAAVNYQLVSKDAFEINASTNFTLNHYKFKEFVDDANDFSGNDLTGVPSKVFNAIIDFNTQFGMYGNLNLQHVGRMPITDTNTLYSDSYNLTNCKIGFKRNLNKKLKLNLFIGLNNIFDTRYASQILINASGFGGNAPRYYYPGNPINYYSGINLNYAF